MARLKKTSPAEDLMDLVAMLPWCWREKEFVVGVVQSKSSECLLGKSRKVDWLMVQGAGRPRPIE